MEAVCVLLDAKPNMVADPNMPGESWAGKAYMDPFFDAGRDTSAGVTRKPWMPNSSTGHQVAVDHVSC
jgi:hypothetical protein